MFRKFILILICTILCVVAANAQRLNGKGLKMVSNIECYSPSTNQLYYSAKFIYSRDDSLVGIDVMMEGRKTVFRKDGNKIRRVSYTKDNEIDVNYRYIYEFDERSGYISARIRDNIGLDGRVLRFFEEYTYNYEKDTTLCYIWERTFFRYYGDKFGELSDRCWQQFDVDKKGNFFSSIMCGYNWKRGKSPYTLQINWNKREYGMAINDTNIDIGEIYDSISQHVFGRGIEFITEWMGCRSANLLVKSRITKFDGQTNYFRHEYEYDIKGNVVSCKVYYPNSEKMEKHIKIKYCR